MPLSTLEQEMLEGMAAEATARDIPNANVEMSGIPGVQMMKIAPEHEGAWIMAWGLSLDADGNEYGYQVPLPRGQLGHYMAKRRPDGGARFTMTMPTRVKAEPQFRCFIKDCPKRVDERIKLIGHIENYHTQEAIMYKAQLDRLRDAVIKDNTRLAKIMDDLIDATEVGIVSVPKDVIDAQPEPPAYVPEEPSVVSGIVQRSRAIFDCDDCDRFFDSEQGLSLHVIKVHKKKEAASA